MTELGCFTFVISSEVRKLELGTEGCATALDSSLRCAPFRMTGKGRCVRNDKGRGVAFGMTKDEGAAFRMTE